MWAHHPQKCYGIIRVGAQSTCLGYVKGDTLALAQFSFILLQQ
jgi:hypothetical protein